MVIEVVTAGLVNIVFEVVVVLGVTTVVCTGSAAAIGVGAVVDVEVIWAVTGKKPGFGETQVQP